MADELERKHSEMAPTSGRRETPTPLGSHSHGCSPEHGVREGTCGDQPTSRNTRPDRATRFVETTRGILSYSELG